MIMSRESSINSKSLGKNKPTILLAYFCVIKKA